MISGIVTPECALGVLRGEGIAPLISPPRRVLVVVDAVLVISILWLLLAPIWPVSIGPSSGYQEPDLDRTLREQAGASAEVGTLPRPWMSNATRGRAIGGKRKQHKKKKWKKRRQGQRDEEDETVAAAAQSQAPSEPSCVPKAEHHCVANGRRVVVTLSIGKRSHFAVTRLPMEAYARRVGAEFVVVDSFAHVAIASWNATLQAGANSHFIKLPLLQWYLRRYDQLLFIDDDVIVSPYAADVFAATPCQELGAVYEGFHKQGWHAMHGRAFCSLYGLEATLPSVCSPEAVKRVRIFNSGVMVMSSAHLPLLDGWDRRKLECRILCDQLYLNAMVRQRGVRVRARGLHASAHHGARALPHRYGSAACACATWATVTISQAPRCDGCSRPPLPCMQALTTAPHFPTGATGARDLGSRDRGRQGAAHTDGHVGRGCVLPAPDRAPGQAVHVALPAHAQSRSRRCDELHARRRARRDGRLGGALLGAGRRGG